MAIGYYEKALGYAREANLDEYIASVCLAMAEALIDMGELSQAGHAAWEANDAAAKTTDLELRTSISDLLLRLADGT